MRWTKAGLTTSDLIAHLGNIGWRVPPDDPSKKHFGFCEKGHWRKGIDGVAWFSGLLVRINFELTDAGTRRVWATWFDHCDCGCGTVICWDCQSWPGTQVPTPQEVLEYFGFSKKVYKQ